MENKEKIIIPKGIRYVSQWEGYSLKNYEFPHILDKKSLAVDSRSML